MFHGLGAVLLLGFGRQIAKQAVEHFPDYVVTNHFVAETL